MVTLEGNLAGISFPIRTAPEWLLLSILVVCALCSGERVPTYGVRGHAKLVVSRGDITGE